jgi:transposase
MNKKIVFKHYNMDQLKLPIDVEVMIPENHLVKVVNAAIEKMDINPLLEKYKGGGTSSYHPKMLLKVLVYAYCQRTYSSRQIAKGLRENIHFMWLSGNNQPDFRTINRFRSSVMKDIIDEIFSAVIKLLVEAGHVKLEKYFLDGTKIEANANKYSFVWKKSTEKNKARLEDKIKELIKHINEVNEEENREYGDKDLEELGEDNPIDSGKLDEFVKELDEKLSKNPKDKKTKKAARIIKKDYLPRLKKYEEQQEILGERNSYSKTDKDAIFMRMKEDHMKNGQLKPGYNVQMGTEEQFIVGFSLHQNAGDTTCMIPHLKGLEENIGRLPENIVADAGYGSEENYEYLEKNELGNYVKYNMFHYEQKQKFKGQIFKVENLPYDEEKDEFSCPNGKKLRYTKTEPYKTANGYITEHRRYECEDCRTCPFKGKCTKAKGNREIKVSFRLNELKQKARENLCSEKGIKLRKKRCVEVESVFGQIKNNRWFRRFLLRGIEKVKTEWGLLCMAHNMKKLAIA